MAGKQPARGELRSEFGFLWRWDGDYWRSCNLCDYGNAVLLFPRTPRSNCWTVRAYRGQSLTKRTLYCEMTLRGRDAERRAFFLGSSLTCGATSHRGVD